MNAVLRPVFTVADEELIRFVIFSGHDDNGLPEFDDFRVDRKEAALIVRKHHADRAYIERRRPEEQNYAFGDYYIEPKVAA